MRIIFTKDLPTEGGLYLRRDPERTWNDPVLLKVTKASEGRCWAEWGTTPRDVRGIGGEWSGPLIEGEPLAGPTIPPTVIDALNAARKELGESYEKTRTDGRSADDAYAQGQWRGITDAIKIVAKFVGEPLAGPGVGVPVAEQARIAWLEWAERRERDTTWRRDTNGTPGNMASDEFLFTEGFLAAIEAAERAAPAAEQPKAIASTNSPHLLAIVDLIDRIDNRSLAEEGPVTPTIKAMTGHEFGQLCDHGQQAEWPEIRTIVARWHHRYSECTSGDLKQVYHLAREVLSNRHVQPTTAPPAGPGELNPGATGSLVGIIDNGPAHVAGELPKPKKIFAPPRPLGLPSREELARVMYEAAKRLWDQTPLWSTMSHESRRVWLVEADAALARIAEGGGKQKEQPIVYYGVPVQVCEAAHAELESATSIEAIRARVLLKSAIETTARRKDRGAPQPIVYGVPWEACERMIAAISAARGRTAVEQLSEARAAKEAAEADKTVLLQRLRRIAHFEPECDEGGIGVKEAFGTIRGLAIDVLKGIDHGPLLSELAELRAKLASLKEKLEEDHKIDASMTLVGSVSDVQVINRVLTEEEIRALYYAGEEIRKSLGAEITSLRAKLAEAERENEGYRRRHDWDLVKQDIEELSSLKSRAAQLEAVLRKVEYGTYVDGNRCPCCHWARESNAHAPDCELAAALGGDGAKKGSEGRDG